MKLSTVLLLGLLATFACLTTAQNDDISPESAYPDLRDGGSGGRDDDGYDDADRQRAAAREPSKPEVPVKDATGSSMVQFGVYSKAADHVRRAWKYLNMAKQFFNTAVKAEKTRKAAGDDVEFIYAWQTIQHMAAARELGHGVASIMRQLAELAFRMELEIEDPGIQAVETCDMVREAVLLNHSSAPYFLQRLRTLLRKQKNEKPEEWRPRIKEEIKILSDPEKLFAGEVPPHPQSFSLPEDASHVVPNPLSSGKESFKCDDKKCDFDVDKLSLADLTDSFETHSLWPARVSALRLPLPRSASEQLTKLAVDRYTRFTEKHKGETQAEINNAFFGDQAKADFEQSTPEALEFWPELYRDSTEFKMLKVIAKEACIEHVLRIGRKQKREDLEKMNLVIWAAVYYQGTTHFNHIHEQAVCSGVYYSQNPKDHPTPIIFSDPRGLHPNWFHKHYEADKGKEIEPEAPFHGTVAFLPRSGDIVLFPSYMPHRVPPHHTTKDGAIKEARVAWAFNLEGPIDAWARVNV